MKKVFLPAPDITSDQAKSSPKNFSAGMRMFFSPAILMLTTILVLFFEDTHAQPLSVTITSTNLTCYQNSSGTATANATGGNPPYTYFWSTWETTATITNLWAGQYDVTVTDEDFTQVTASVTLTEPPQIQISAVVTHVTCFGESTGAITASASDGIPPYMYAWSNGETGPTISDVPAGFYEVTVTDDNDCLASENFIIAQPQELQIQLNQIQHESCFGMEDGYLEISPFGGTAPFTINWSNGFSTTSISNLAPGDYIVTVTDDNSCTTMETYTIEEGNDVELALIQIEDVSCFGESNGSISVVASDGDGPYTYLWSNGLTGPVITNLPIGTYSVTVNDTDDCAETDGWEITQPPELILEEVEIQHETCAGADDGSITIQISGGESPYLAQWSNGLQGLSINNLSPDIYTVSVTDDAGCFETETFEILSGNVIEAELVEIQHVSCDGGSDGLLSISGTGGNAPYTYLWSNGTTGPLNDGLTADTYMATITDGFGCSGNEEYTISEPLPISISITQTSQNPCFGDTLASLSATVTGGIPAYTALWSDGSTGLVNSNLGAGAYTVTITDFNSCLANQSYTITDPLLLTVTIATTNETGNDANDGTATATPTGGTPVHTYLWSNGATTSTITGLAPGSYSVTITDMNGCTVDGSEQVLAFGCVLDVMSGADFSICEDDTTTITPLVTGANGNVEYLWGDSSTAEFLQVIQAGEYCVTVTDGANCQNADCIVIGVSVVPPLTCPVTDESVPGANDGAIQCDSLPGNIIYLWSNGEMTSSISGLSPGEYCVTITDTIGCSSTQCFNVQPANCQLSSTDSVTHVSCHGEATGSVILSVTGGNEPVTFTWSNGATSATVENLVSGNYTVTIADAAGCIVNGSYTITEPSPITIVLDSVGKADATGSGLIWITVSGGMPGYNYQWVDPNGGFYVTEDLNGLMLSGFYFLEVTDTAGCVARLDSVFVDQNVAVEHLLGFRPVKIYPIPTDEVLYIDLEEVITEIEISSADGRVYKKISKPESNKINVSDIQPGWYVLRIFVRDQVYCARMVK
ncbi:MAG TPA: T9SS type A sorting domain-containing protein [Saprospiraceae bacterium]